MAEKDTERNLSQQEMELQFAIQKINEYPNHIPQYDWHDSYYIILKLLYPEKTLSDELINSHIDTIAHFHSKISEPNFKEPQLSASETICSNGQYTKNQDIRLHLLCILFNGAETIYNPLSCGISRKMFNYYISTFQPFLDVFFYVGIRHQNYAFFAKQLINSDLNSKNIPSSLNPILKEIAHIFQNEIALFQKEFELLQVKTIDEAGLFEKNLNSILNKLSDQLTSFNKQKQNNLLKLKKHLNSIKEMIIKLCSASNKLPPFWPLDNDAIIEQDENIFIPTSTDKKNPEFVLIYSYYLIIWNYIAMQEKKYTKKPLNNFKTDSYNKYKSYVQACYAFYLLELCPQYYELKELSRTIRYYFAYKVFYETESLLYPYMQPINNHVLLLEPYKTTFLKVDYTRPESTAKRKKLGQHSTISEHYDIKLLVEKIKIMLYGGLTNNNEKPIYIALPQKNNSRYIGSRNLAYVLGVPESKDFFDKILNNKPLNPKIKIVQKISDRWPYSINILSFTYKENIVPVNILFNNNLGFLLNENELKDLSRCVKILKKKIGGLNNITKEIKVIAKTEKNYITPFDIAYFELFDECLCSYNLYPYQLSTPPYSCAEYLWFTLPFIHITNALSIITGKIIKSHIINSNIISNILSDKLEEIYEYFGKSFSIGNINYAVADIEKIKVDAIIMNSDNMSPTESPIDVKTKKTEYYKYIIKTFKPINENNQIQEDLLKSYYFSSLNLAMRNDCHSIAFPSYFFEKESFKSINILRSWQRKHYGYYIDINICFQSKKDIETMQTKMNNFFADKIKSSKTTLIRDFQKRNG